MKTTLTQNGCKRIMIILSAFVVNFNLVNIASAQITDFVAVPTEGYAPLSVHFTDLSTWSAAHTREWEFPGGVPGTATGTEVDVVYNTPGTYTVTLKISLSGQDVGQEIKTDYITVYPVPVTDYGDAPDPPYPTLQVNDGAMHLIDLNLYLGDLVDSEDDGQEHPEALGDDHDGSNDDDGVEITDLIAGFTNTIVVKAHGGGGVLSAWIDFNNNGNWDDGGEHVVIDEGLADGGNSVAIDVPASAAVGFVLARFRYSRQPGLSYDGVAQDGEVEDYKVEIHEPQSLDYGDAPDTREFSIYPTYLANDGARHPVSPIIFLGDTVDIDLDGQPDILAMGDDTDGIDDEDGVVIPQLVPGVTNTIRVKTHLGATLNVGYLNAWIDFYANNDWDDPDEQIFDGEELGDGWHDLEVFVPADAVVGETYARFRFGLDPDLDYTGLSEHAGEVEDYRPRIIDPDTLDFGDAPDDDTYHYQTMLPGGARHRISDDIYLGSLIDGEADGQQDETATLDDNNGERDEDGIILPLEIIPGGPLDFTVSTHGSGWLRGWCDFNGNNEWDHPDEMFINELLGEGDHPLRMEPIPEDAAIGRTYVRFRYSNDQSIGPGGWGAQGEVEDYVIWIVSGDSLDYGDAPDDDTYRYPTLLEHDGARHPISDEIYLGAIPGDGEDDGPQGTNADGDDLNAVEDDEDGVTFLDDPLVQGQPASIRVTMHGRAVLQVFIDWNADGNWEGPGEHPIMHDNVIGDLTRDFDVNVPDDAAIGPTYARFRYGYLPPVVGFSGLGGPGEVEDYLIEIVPGDSLDFGDAPDANGFAYMTLRPFGASHLISDEIYLGAYIDGEPDGIETLGAMGDDLTGSPDDEDGIVIPDLVPGQYATLTVTVHVSGDRVGRLHGWIDFEKNGNWVDPGEYVTGDAAAFTFATSGTYSRDILVPADAELGATYARFRFSSDPELHFANPGSEGEVEDYIVQVVLDFGDAPDDGDRYRYRTLLRSEGARHPMSDEVYLGTRPDGERDGWQSIDALGDDTHPPADDENGVIIPHLVPGFPAFIEVTYHNALGVDTYFRGWIDWDRDGLWEELAGERVLNVVFPAGTRTTELAINVPPDAVPGPTYARFRLSPDEVLPYFGVGNVGEVEDYRVIIDERPWDFGDAPDDGVDPVYPTLSVHDGARHLIDPDIYLGERIDAETDGQPHSDALGDDLADQDDDDGVVFDTELNPGLRARITVTASVDGILDAWADFDGDGDWMGAGEEIFFDEALRDGPNSLDFEVPDRATAGRVFFRFRFFSVEGPIFRAAGDHTVGPYINGEVEDYLVEIGEHPGPGPEDVPGALKWFQPPLKNRKSFYPNSFWGWDEPSIYTEQIIADDWFCADPRPVTGIRWWGSYCEWDSVVPPPYAPENFHVAIWTDTNEPWKQRRGVDHPDSLVWEQVVGRAQLYETVVGSDFFPSYMQKPDSCFQYDLAIPEDDWFHQEGDSTYYWLSISAKYAEQSPDQYAWGWKTRDRYFRGDAVRILAPTEPALDSLYRSGETMHRGWDMSFVLFTTDYGQSFDYGDAQDPEYPTEFDNNGAHHMLWPGIYMGETIDSESDGKSDAEALSDDNVGIDDEDGVEFTSDLDAGGIATITVNASIRGVLNAWIDYNADGEWGDPGEHIFINMPLFAGNNNLAYNIPLSASATSTYARFRFSAVGGITPKGLDIGGEVEDYELTISPATAVEEDLIRGQIPKRFELMQNYPNPFNPETTIKFQLPQAGEVLLTIFDIYGREVRTLLHGEWSPGSHAVIWDGRDRSGQIVATGMYFYRIDVRTIIGERKKYVDVKKMIFMK